MKKCDETLVLPDVFDVVAVRLSRGRYFDFFDGVTVDGPHYGLTVHVAGAIALHFKLVNTLILVHEIGF